ncbi:MAG: hypothetical protein VBE63_14735 [Lamprobacter sp.]|uniref:hypothetical protein n=1 Tax=Lamprobacter sp. TaxID=3100796 RepID=UPI002B25AFF7|nr:hypothetical protein [Lamprobacter sp.]MEA3641178.1 hypothetical protein [Lamprobacter sp.]
MRIVMSLIVLSVFFSAHLNAQENNEIAGPVIGCKDKNLAKENSEKFFNYMRSGNKEAAKDMLRKFSRVSDDKKCHFFSKGNRVIINDYDPVAKYALVAPNDSLIPRNKDGSDYWVDESYLVLSVNYSDYSKNDNAPSKNDNYLSKNTIGCTTRESFGKIASSGVYDPVKSPGCISLAKGTKVELLEKIVLAGVSKIRPLDDTESYWVPSGFVGKSTDLASSEKFGVCKFALSKVNANSAAEYDFIKRAGDIFYFTSARGYKYNCEVSGLNISLSSKGWGRIQPTGNVRKSNGCISLTLYDPGLMITHKGEYCEN